MTSRKIFFERCFQIHLFFQGNTSKIKGFWVTSVLHFEHLSQSFHLLPVGKDLFNVINENTRSMC